jgi:hypothetical protein
MGIGMKNEVNLRVADEAPDRCSDRIEALSPAFSPVAGHEQEWPFAFVYRRGWQPRLGGEDGVDRGIARDM